MILKIKHIGKTEDDDHWEYIPHIEHVRQFDKFVKLDEIKSDSASFSLNKRNDKLTMCTRIAVNFDNTNYENGSFMRIYYCNTVMYLLNENGNTIQKLVNQSG